MKGIYDKITPRILALTESQFKSYGTPKLTG